MAGGVGVQGESTTEAKALEAHQPSTPIEDSLGHNSNILTMSSVPGMLMLSPSRAEALVTREPLHQLYIVENQPFAR